MSDDTKDTVKDKFAQRFENETTDKQDAPAVINEQATQPEHAHDADRAKNAQDAKNMENDEASENDRIAENAGSEEHAKASQPIRIKDAWPNHSVYLPEDTADVLSATYKKLDWQLDAEYGLDIKKTRHYYPLVVQLGLERFEELDQEEVKERIERIEPEQEYFD